MVRADFPWVKIVVIEEKVVYFWARKRNLHLINSLVSNVDSAYKPCSVNQDASEN